MSEPVRSIGKGGIGFGVLQDQDITGTRSSNVFTTLSARGILVETGSYAEDHLLAAGEIDITYNVIGRTNDGELATSAFLNGRGLLGYHFLERHQKGCDIYTGLAVDAQGMFRKEGDEVSGDYHVGPETGILCRSRNFIFTAGPSVSLGGYNRDVHKVEETDGEGDIHRDTNAGVGVDDWSFGGGVRLAMRDRFYASVFADRILTKDQGENAATAARAVFDYELTDKWAIGALGEIQHFDAGKDDPSPMNTWSTRLMLLRRF